MITQAKILADEQTKKILLSSDDKALRLRMRNVSQRTFPMAKQKSDTGGAGVMGDPHHFSKEG